MAPMTGRHAAGKVMFPSRAFNEALGPYERTLMKMKQEAPDTVDLVYALEEGDCEERDGALQLIAAISESQPEIGRQLLPQVLSALDDPAQKVQMAALQVIGVLGAREHLALVVELLTDPTLRVGAVDCLGKLKAWHLAEELRQCLSDADPEVVRAALRAAESWGEDGQVLASAVVQCLDHACSGVRRDALRALASCAEASERFAGRVALLLNDQDLQVQEACVAFFASLGPRGRRRARGVAEDFLTKSCAAALALGHMRAVESIPQIASQLVPGHDAALALSSVGLQPRLDVELRRPECAAAMALSLMGPEGSIYADSIADLLGQDLPSDAEASLIRSLASMGPSGHKGTLLGYLEHPQSLYREAACSATSLLQEEGVDALLSLLNDSHATVRRRAVEALGELQEVALYVDHIAVLLDDPVPAVQAEALRSLTKCGQEGEAYSAIVCRMAVRDGDSMVRQAALESLGRVQGLGLEVAKCLEDRDPLVRAAACKAMALLEEGQDHLLDLDLLRSDPHEAVRKAADEALIALGS